MKKIISLFFLMAFLSLVYAENQENTIFNKTDNDKIKIASIKIVIDDVMYIWNNKLQKPALYEDYSTLTDTPSKLNPQTILSYTNLKPDTSMSIKALKAETKQTEIRLIDSGLVYSAKVTVVPPRKNPDKRTVIIEIKSGFFYRFAGGNAYGMFGRSALKGNRDLLSLYAGYNKNGVSYINENVFDAPLIMGTSLFWNAPECFIAKEDSILSIYEIAGFRPLTDLTIGIRMMQDLDFSESVKSSYCFEPFINYKKHFSTKSYLDLEIQSAFNLDSSVYCNGAVSFNFSPLERICISTMTSAGVTPFIKNSKESIGAFNLYSVNNCYSENRALNNLIIRSGYLEEELCTDSYFLQALELRFKLFEFTIPPVFLCSVIPFVYIEAAYIDKANEICDGFGGGTRILLDNPIFAYFTFSYGINHKLQPRFCFSTSAGF